MLRELIIVIFSACTSYFIIHFIFSIRDGFLEEKEKHDKLKKYEDYYKDKYNKLRDDYFILADKYINENNHYEHMYDNLLDDFIDLTLENLELENNLKKRYFQGLNNGKKIN